MVAPIHGFMTKTENSGFIGTRAPFLGSLDRAGDVFLLGIVVGLIRTVVAGVFGLLAGIMSNYLFQRGMHEALAGLAQTIEGVARLIPGVSLELEGPSEWEASSIFAEPLRKLGDSIYRAPDGSLFYSSRKSGSVSWNKDLDGSYSSGSVRGGFASP